VALTHRRSRGRYVVAALLLASLTLITLDARGSGALKSVRNGVQTVLTPVENGVHAALRPVGNFLTGAAEYGSLKAKYDKLSSEYATAEAQAAANAYESQQLKEANEQFNVPFATGVAQLSASVIGQPESNFDQVVTIDKGTSSGVGVSQPVVGRGGLIGQIASAAHGTASVELLTQPGFTCGAALAEGNIGIVRGEGVGRDLQMTVQPNAGKVATLKKGQEIYTSNVGGSFPAGIPIGKIVSVDTSTASTTATIAPAVNTSDLSFVDILLWSAQ
jgi:rod shape-determining protein MreC